MIKYYLFYNEDYRGNVDYKFLKELYEDEDMNEGYLIDFEIDEKQEHEGFRVYYLCFDNNEYEMIKYFIKNIEKIEEADNLIEQVHTKINESGTFIVTSHNSAYKEKGYYKDAVEISEDTIKYLSRYYEKPKVVIVVDKNGEIVKYKNI